VALQRGVRFLAKVRNRVRCWKRKDLRLKKLEGKTDRNNLRHRLFLLHTKKKKKKKHFPKILKWKKDWGRRESERVFGSLQFAITLLILPPGN
jgi:hypothetical protein